MQTSLTEHCEKKNYLAEVTMKEILTAQNRFRNNLLLALESAPSLNYYALCSGVSLTETVTIILNKSSTFSCDILKEYLLLL